MANIGDNGVFDAFMSKLSDEQKREFLGNWDPTKIKIVEEPKEVIKDNVNNPAHYAWLKEKCGIGVIDITRWLDFDTGNAIKYLLRAGHKSEEGMTDKEKTIQDLKKAVWYIHDRIKMLEDESSAN